MKDIKNNPYGYKVCYREEGSNKYIRYFKTYTYSEAETAISGYIRYPPRARTDDHLLNNPEWVIIPVKISEVLSGIWLEAPF